MFNQSPLVLKFLIFSITSIPTVYLFYGIVFKHSMVISILIVLLWFSIVHYSSLFQYFFINLLSYLKTQMYISCSTLKLYSTKYTQETTLVFVNSDIILYMMTDLLFCLVPYAIKHLLLSCNAAIQIQWHFNSSCG